MTERVYLKEVRISYPHLFQPRAFEGGPPKYSASFIVPQGHPGLAEIQAAIGKVVAEAQLDPQRMRPIPWSDGGTEFPGCWIIRTNATTKPHVVDQSVKPVIDVGLIYAGCYVNGYISVYAYKRQTGNGIAFGLDGVQYVREGDRLDGRPTAEQMFQPVQGSPAPAPGAPVPGPAPGPAPTPVPGKPDWV